MTYFITEGLKSVFSIFLLNNVSLLSYHTVKNINLKAQYSFVVEA